MDGLVARLVLGSAQWGMPYGIANTSGQPSRDEVARLVEHARAAGVDTLDTARAYGDSESVVGALVGEDRRWTVVTKLPPLGPDGDAGAHLAASRRALRRERLDVLLLHDPTDRARPDVWRLLQGERDAGRIGLLGISARTPDEAEQALDDPDVAAMQVAASLADQRLERRGFFARAREAGKRVFVRSTYLQGAAHLPSLPPHLAALAPVRAAVDQWARARGLSRAAAWLLYARGLDVELVVGCERAAQLDENLRLFALPLLDAEARRELGALVPELPEAVVNPARWPR